MYYSLLRKDYTTVTAEKWKMQAMWAKYNSQTTL